MITRTNSWFINVMIALIRLYRRVRRYFMQPSVTSLGSNERRPLVFSVIYDFGYVFVLLIRLFFSPLPKESEP